MFSKLCSNMCLCDGAGGVDSESIISYFFSILIHMRRQMNPPFTCCVYRPFVYPFCMRPPIYVLMPHMLRIFVASRNAWTAQRPMERIEPDNRPRHPSNLFTLFISTCRRMYSYVSSSMSRARLTRNRNHCQRHLRSVATHARQIQHTHAPYFSVKSSTSLGAYTRFISLTTHIM